MYRSLPAFVTLSAVLIVVGVVPAAPVPTHLMKTGPVYYYPTTVGTKWVYEEGGEEETFAITKVEDADGDKVVTVEQVIGAKSTPYEKMLVSKEGLVRVESIGVKYDPPSVMLKSPLQAGNKWKSDSGRSEENAMIVGLEKVRVPAGTFEAIRVDAKYVTGGQKEPASFWYAPGVGLVKWSHDGKDRVLKAFTPGKG